MRLADILDYTLGPRDGEPIDIADHPLGRWHEGRNENVFTMHTRWEVMEN